MKPSETELLIELIKAELKSARLFNGLSMAGLEDCYYRSRFVRLIARYLGFEEDSEEFIEYVEGLVDRYSEEIKPDDKIITQLARDLYSELIEKINTGAT